jgi:hypothetical protein
MDDYTILEGFKVPYGILQTALRCKMRTQGESERKGIVMDKGILSPHPQGTYWGVHSYCGYNPLEDIYEFVEAETRLKPDDEPLRFQKILII